jgi:hypothetical protein
MYIIGSAAQISEFFDPPTLFLAGRTKYSVIRSDKSTAFALFFVF